VTVHMAKFLRVDIGDGVALVSLNDPSAAVNTVSAQWVEEMDQTFVALKADPDVTGIIITSGKSGFMAGADLKLILADAKHMSASAAFAFSQRATRMHRAIETCGKPVVAAINGFALGGGYELALACSHRIVVDDAKAVVGLPEVTVGLLPGSGGTQRLLRLIGLQRATDVLLEGRSYAPAAALELGMIDAVVAPVTLIEEARRWLKTCPDAVRAWDKKGFKLPESEGLLRRSTADFFANATARLLAKYGQNYPAPIAILASLFEGMQVPLDKALLVESRYFAKLMTDPIASNLIRTMFVNKGLADKGTSRQVKKPSTTTSRIGVLGAGMMGAGIAYVAAKSGIDVVLLDTSQAAAEKGKAYSGKLLAREVERGKSTAEDAEALLSRITPTTRYTDLAEVELVIEAVFEDTRIKSDVTHQAELAAPRLALFASNTSTLPISQLAQAFSRPADFIGLHFFSPVDRMSLVEVILGKQTGELALSRALDFVRQIRKTPIIVNDSRGFFTSRVFQTFIHEGMELLREGVAPALIENAAKQAGMPVGPLAVTDETTLELPLKIIRQREIEDPAYRRPNSAQVLEKMVDQLHRPGRKGGAGFYEYPKEGNKKLWPALTEHFPLAAHQPDVREVRNRLLYIQALETARCLEEKVLIHAADGDLGSVLGWGFPAWSGGALSLIDTIGAGTFVTECEQLAERCGPRFTPTEQLRNMAASGTGFSS
jgi:3-hydroxyacyl-CoA dehydrogenase / enoyl-CoA hydratase / 3-hydroxybutyryl-CoA epimerase